MHNRKWSSVPDWAQDLIQLQLIQISQNEEILAALQRRESRLTARDRADLAEIAEISADTKRKLDDALKP